MVLMEVNIRMKQFQTYLAPLYIEKKVSESLRYIEFRIGISPETRGHISMDVIRLSKLFRWRNWRRPIHSSDSPPPPSLPSLRLFPTASGGKVVTSKTFRTRSRNIALRSLVVNDILKVARSRVDPRRLRLPCLKVP